MFPEAMVINRFLPLISYMNAIELQRIAKQIVRLENFKNYFNKKFLKIS